jgi:hypothetical protein
MAFEDCRGIVPRDAPLMIWIDPVRLDWSEPERPEFSAGGHFRPREQNGKPVLTYRNCPIWLPKASANQRLKSDPTVMP